MDKYKNARAERGQYGHAGHSCAQAAPLSRHNLGDEELLRVNVCCSP